MGWVPFWWGVGSEGWAFPTWKEKKRKKSSALQDVSLCRASGAPSSLENQNTLGFCLRRHQPAAPGPRSLGLSLSDGPEAHTLSCRRWRTLHVKKKKKKKKKKNTVFDAQVDHELWNTNAYLSRYCTYLWYIERVSYTCQQKQTSFLVPVSDWAAFWHLFPCL